MIDAVEAVLKAVAAVAPTRLYNLEYYTLRIDAVEEGWAVSFDLREDKRVLGGNLWLLLDEQGDVKDFRAEQ